MAANDKLKQILDDLTKAKKNASLDVLAWPDPRTRPSAQLRKTKGMEDVVKLTQEYSRLVSKHFLRVFVGGERAKDFATFAASGGAVVADGVEFYDSLAKGVAQSQDPKSPRFGPHQQLRLTAELSFYGRANGYVSVMAPRPIQGNLDTPTPTHDVLVAQVRSAIRATNGDDLNRLHLERKILANAIEVAANTNIIPVIITGLTTEEVQGLSKTLFGGSPAMDLTAGPDSTNDGLLKAINAKIRSVKATNKQ